MDTGKIDIVPLLRFGIVADVQYADSDDKQAWYNPNKTRFYRNSLKQVEKAFDYWEKLDSTGTKVGFILQLGDIIDAINTSSNSQLAIRRTLSCFLNNEKMPTFHTIGNHELYNFNRTDLSNLFDQFLFKQINSDSSLNLSHPMALTNDDSFPLYYKFCPMKGIKFISLDMYDISVLGYNSTHYKYKMASDILESYHGSIDLDLWDTDQKLTGSDKRFQSSNGALSEEQLSWLDQELNDSDDKSEVVIVFGHVGLHPQSCGWDSILWNHHRVIDCFNRHSSVIAYFNGHAHTSGYAFDNGIHYVVFHGIIETSPDNDAFATATVYNDKIVIDGMGVEQNLILNLRKKVDVSSTTCNDFAETICDHIEEVHLTEIEVTV